jgi:hypothetical protein
VVVHLPSKHEALSSNPDPDKKWWARLRKVRGRWSIYLGSKEREDACRRLPARTCALGGTVRVKHLDFLLLLFSLLLVLLIAKTHIKARGRSSTAQGFWQDGKDREGMETLQLEIMFFRTHKV